jgi:hypothetical protein
VSIKAYPPGVARAGDDLLEATEDAKQRISNQLATTEAVIGAHPGWETSAGLERCRHAWKTALEGIVDRTRRTAEDLRTAAGNMSSGDREAADRLGNVLDELGGP